MYSTVVNKLLQYSTEVCGLKSAIFACVTNYIGVERKENQEITVPDPSLATILWHYRKKIGTFFQFSKNMFVISL